MTLETAARLVEVPDEGVATGGVTIVGWVDARGNQKYSWLPHGDMSVSTLLGLLALVSHRLACRHRSDDA